MDPDDHLFTVMPPDTRSPKAATRYVLVRDRWDDYGFKTQYALYRSGGDRIGDLKILRVSQQPSSTGVLPDGPIGTFGPEFCSLGQDLDYYERVAALGPDERGALMAALRDAAADPEHALAFSGEVGWTDSVCRDIDDPVGYAKVASILLTRDYDALPDLDVDLTFHAAGWLAPLRLAFGSAAGDGPLSGRRRGTDARLHLPRRVTVLTGRNGSGKSTLLARLARVLHASQADRRGEVMRAIGTLEPAGIGFTRVVTVSYSAFDSFEVPGLGEEERRQIAKDVEAGSGRFVFCGLRDIARELEDEIGATDGVAQTDRRRTTRLKPLEALAAEFDRTASRIRDGGRWPLFEAVAELLLADPSFADMGVSSLAELLGAEASASFMAWSTGHKIVLHLVASLVAYTEPRSMVLIDEPETHLHPPLLAAMMHATRFVLEERGAFAVCATHSPVVVQETLARHVRVVRRSGPAATISPPAVETFGESIGEITDEVFGLNAEATDYHAVLAGLLAARGSTDAVEKLFEGGLSLQARAYLMTLAVSAPPPPT